MQHTGICPLLYLIIINFENKYMEKKVTQKMVHLVHNYNKAQRILLNIFCNELLVLLGHDTTSQGNIFAMFVITHLQISNSLLFTAKKLKSNAK
jgi:hypothetical protein